MQDNNWLKGFTALLWLVIVIALIIPFTGLLLWVMFGEGDNSLLGLWKYSIAIAVAAFVTTLMMQPKEQRLDIFYPVILILSPLWVVGAVLRSLFYKLRPKK